MDEDLIGWIGAGGESGDGEWRDGGVDGGDGVRALRMLADGEGDAGVAAVRAGRDEALDGLHV